MLPKLVLNGMSHKCTCVFILLKEGCQRDSVLTPFVFRRREGQVVLPEPGRSESLRETNCCDSQSLRDDFLGGRVPWRLGVGEHSGVGEHNARSSSICLLIASVPVPGALFSPVEFPIIHPLRPDKRLIDHTTATCAACPH